MHTLIDIRIALKISIAGTACAIAVQFGHFAAESIHVTLKKNL